MPEADCELVRLIHDYDFEMSGYTIFCTRETPYFRDIERYVELHGFIQYVEDSHQEFVATYILGPKSYLTTPLAAPFSQGVSFIAHDGIYHRHSLGIPGGVCVLKS